MIEPGAVVFVVDDDPSVRRSTERLLRSAGLTVQTYSSAQEFLTNPFRGRSLVDAVRAAIERACLAHKEGSETRELHERYEQLTPREREVMPLVAAGLLNKQVAGELATTERTIKFHRAHIMQKMGAESLADLVRMVEKLGASK